MKVYFFTNLRGNWFYGPQRFDYWHLDSRWITACNGLTINFVPPLNVFVTVAHLKSCSQLRYWVVKGMCQFYRYIDDSEPHKRFSWYVCNTDQCHIFYCILQIQYCVKHSLYWVILKTARHAVIQILQF